MRTKICFTCNEDKPLEEFRFRSRLRSNGTRYYKHERTCIHCENKRRRENYDPFAPRVPPRTPDRYGSDVAPFPGWGHNPYDSDMLILKEALNKWNS